LPGDGADDFLTAVSGVGYEDSGGPVDPAVAVGVEDLEAFGALPDDRGLALHGEGFQTVEFVQQRQGLGDGYGRHDPS
jgi:hypothetical protein